MRTSQVITISPASQLLSMLNAIADERHMNRSELFGDILREFLEKQESGFQRY